MKNLIKVSSLVLLFMFSIMTSSSTFARGFSYTNEEASDGDMLAAGKNMLMTHGYTDATVDHLTVGVMYFIMVLSLFFMGAGRFFSVDWFLHRKLQRSIDAKEVSVSDSYDSDPFDIDTASASSKSPS